MPKSELREKAWTRTFWSLYHRTRFQEHLKIPSSYQSSSRYAESFPFEVRWKNVVDSGGVARELNSLIKNENVITGEVVKSLDEPLGENPYQNREKKRKEGW